MKNYLKRLYSGRIGRKHYFLGWLFFYLALILILGTSLAATNGDAPGIFAMVLIFVAYAAFIVYTFSLHVRRLHDLGESGHKAWLCVIPLVNLIVLLWLLFTKGQPADNAYGPPLASNAKFFDVILGRGPLPAGGGAASAAPTAGTDKRYCYKCGTQIDADSKFCVKCGTKVPRGKAT